MEAQVDGFISLMSLAQGYIISGALYALAKKGVAQSLMDGSKSSAQLAREIDADPDTLERFMNALAECGVFDRAGDLYRLNEVSKNLPVLLDFFIAGEDLLAWMKAEDSITSGKSGWEFANNGSSYYDSLKSNKQYATDFSSWLSKTTFSWVAPIIGSYNFDGLRNIIDLGGGSGDLMNCVADKFKNLNCVVYDLDKNPACNVFKENVQFMKGNIIEYIPGGYDVYVLSRVLLNHPDDVVLEILNNCMNAMSINSKLLILDFLLPSKDSPFYRQLLLQDLHLKIIHNGKNRTFSDLLGLLQRAKLTVSKELESKNMPLMVGLEVVKVS